MKIMTKKFKYCIIITAILMLFTVKIYAVGPGDGTTGNSWKITTSHIGSLVNFWCEWIYIHFGQGVDAKIKAGEGAGSGIIYIDKTEGKSNDVEAYGYGSYQFDLKKHMVGYLYYLKDHANYNSQTDITKTPEEYFTETGHYAEPPNLNFKDACKYVADKLMVTAYSKDTVNEYLNRLLAFIETHISADIVKTCQSDYWYRVYAQRAYGVLTGSLGFRTSGADMRKVHGALLSIMEDRYRDKNLKNKPRMQLSVEKGDLWPFLVYTETNDNGATTDWQITVEDNKGNKKIIHTDWKKMLTGAYQYMVYYEYKVDDEADAVIDKRNIYNGVKAEMFREEYQTLFNEALPELRGKDLDDFYQRIRRIRRYYKKSSDNGGGVFGEEELYDISSDITYSRAIDKLSAKINGEFRDVFKGLDSDYIARTYLMAKNIADTTRLIEQNAQYDIGSNIVNRTPGGYSEQVLLSDLQLITLKRGDDNKFSLDADKDGLIDGRELGSDEGPTTSLKISGFIKKLLKAEAGDSYSSATDPDYMYNMYKANIRDAATAADNAENNGSIVTPGRDKEKFIQTQHDIRVIGDDIYVDVMSYTSNPILKDSDFDGVWDGYGEEDEAHKNQYRDDLPLNNSINGQITMTNGIDLNVSTHMDYRYFFMDKYNYYDELSVMSLILSNAVYGRNEFNLSNLDTINNIIGLNLDYRIVEESDVKPRNYKYKTKYAVGNKPIEYSKDNSATNMIKKRVIPIIIPGMYEERPGMCEESDGRSYSEIGETNWLKNNGDHGEESHNVMSYEIYANAILHDIDNYERNSSDNIPGDKAEEKKVYWVMGYKEGGAIANVLASKLIDQAKDVYAYTFASPMTLYNNSDATGDTDKLKQPISRTGYLARYDCIFNVVNEVDAYCFVMPQKLGFSRYGMTCFGGAGLYNPITNTFELDPKSVSKIVNELIKLYKDNTHLTRIKTYAKDTNPNINKNYGGLYNVYQRLIRAIDIERNNKTSLAADNNIDNMLEFYNRYREVPDLATFINALELNYDKIKRAGYEDEYYNIARTMNNADIVNVVNLYDNRKIRKATGSELDGIHDGTFPCYQVLHNTNSNGATININNEVPAYFQSQEFWSKLRYGTMYRELIDDLKINKYNDKTYSYGTFYASSCGACSPAMVLSYILDKTITPVDVRNMMELYNEEYRNPSATAWSSEGKIAGFFNVLNLAKEDSDRGKNSFSIDPNNGSFKITGLNQKRDAIKYLLKGRPIIALCHDSGGKTNENYGKHSSIFTGSGHYIVISGIGTDSLSNVGINHANIKNTDETVRNAELAKIDILDDSQLDLIEIYVSDPAYYNVKSKTKKRNITPFKISTFYNNSSYKIVMKNGVSTRDWTNDVGDGGVDNMWIYGLGSDCGISGYDGSFEAEEVNGKMYKQFDYNSETYYEEFDPESYTNYDTGSKNNVNDGNDKYHLIKRENTWRTDKCEK